MQFRRCLWPRFPTATHRSPLFEVVAASVSIAVPMAAAALIVGGVALFVGRFRALHAAARPEWSVGRVGSATAEPASRARQRWGRLAVALGNALALPVSFKNRFQRPCRSTVGSRGSAARIVSVTVLLHGGPHLRAVNGGEGVRAVLPQRTCFSVRQMQDLLFKAADLRRVILRRFFRR